MQNKGQLMNHKGKLMNHKGKLMITNGKLMLLCWFRKGCPFPRISTLLVSRGLPVPSDLYFAGC